MKRAALIGTLVVSLVTGSAALADGRGHGNDSDRGGRDHTWSRHGERRDDDRRDFRPYAREEYRAPERYRGYGYNYNSYNRPRDYYSHRWIRGERLPWGYYERPYVIDDYYGYGLYAPPRGHHWVRVDGDAVLAAVATGIVLDTVFHAFH